MSYLTAFCHTLQLLNTMSYFFRYDFIWDPDKDLLNHKDLNFYKRPINAYIYLVKYILYQQMFQMIGIGCFDCSRPGYDTM
jgi:hypothetical protein